MCTCMSLGELPRLQTFLMHLLGVFCVLYLQPSQLWYAFEHTSWPNIIREGFLTSMCKLFFLFACVRENFNTNKRFAVELQVIILAVVPKVVLVDWNVKLWENKRELKGTCVFPLSNEGRVLYIGHVGSFDNQKRAAFLILAFWAKNVVVFWCCYMIFSQNNLCRRLRRLGKYSQLQVTVSFYDGNACAKPFCWGPSLIKVESFSKPLAKHGTSKGYVSVRFIVLRRHEHWCRNGLWNLCAKTSCQKSPRILFSNTRTSRCLLCERIWRKPQTGAPKFLFVELYPTFVARQHFASLRLGTVRLVVTVSFSMVMEEHQGIEKSRCRGADMHVVLILHALASSVF